MSYPSDLTDTQWKRITFFFSHQTFHTHTPGPS